MIDIEPKIMLHNELERIADYRIKFRESIRLVLKNTKFVWLFWLTNFAFAFTLSLPVYYVLSQKLLHSQMSQKLAFGFDYIWFLQIGKLLTDTTGIIPYMIYGSAGIYGLIQIFYLGGTISVFHNRSKNHYVDFFYGGVKYWYRFTKVLLLSLFFYAVAFLVNDYTGYLLTYIFRSGEHAVAEFVLRASRYLLLLFLLGIVSIISDYIKVAMAVHDSDDLFRQIVNTLKFIKVNFSKVFSVFIIVASFGAVGALVYNITGNYLPKTTNLYFVLSFILQQLLIIFRFMIRMLFSSTEVVLYSDLSATIITTNAEEI
jgi:hypothetical protein